MRYLILISLSFLLSCGYEHSYQASIDKQGGHHEEACKLRDASIECTRDAYSFDDIMDCTDVFSKRLEDISNRYGVPIISRKQLSRFARGNRCIDNSQSFYDVKRCELRLYEDMKKLEGC